MEQIDISTLIQVLNVLILPALFAIYNKINQSRKETEMHRNAQNDAILSLLRDRILQSGAYFCEIGAIPGRVKAALLQMGKAYEAMGGNGEGHIMIERVMHLPVDDNILQKAKNKLWQDNANINGMK